MAAVQPILVVENEALIRMGLVDALKAGGYTVSDCGDGASAVLLIDASTELHGLATDIKLGVGSTGWEVAHYARKKFPDIAVVYMTGDGAADWTAEGVPNSILLQKPFAEAHLLTALSTLMIASGPK
jgi:CheY-like chemotaxis protein